MALQKDKACSDLVEWRSSDKNQIWLVFADK